MAETNRTEKPTGKRLSEARKKGQVARSQDLTLAASTLGIVIALATYGYLGLHRLQATVTDGLRRFADRPLHDIQAGELVAIFTSGATLLTVVVGPIALAGVCIGVGTASVQGGLKFATEAISLNWGRLNPSAGLARLAPKNAGVDALKAMVTATILGVLGWRVEQALLADVTRLVWGSPQLAADHGWQAALGLLRQAGLALLAIGGADYAVQRWRLMSTLKMTKQEVKEEMRMMEGDPHIKARVRRVQREMFRSRMLQATKTATVVITNPTHFAVALEYRREKMAAPIVVAKGRDLLAARIREIAREHGVPIMENPALARALYKKAEVGDTIPADLFGAVAEVLAYLVRIKQLML